MTPLRSFSPAIISNTDAEELQKYGCLEAWQNWSRCEYSKSAAKKAFVCQIPASTHTYQRQHNKRVHNNHADISAKYLGQSSSWPQLPDAHWMISADCSSAQSHLWIGWRLLQWRDKLKQVFKFAWGPQSIHCYCSGSHQSITCLLRSNATFSPFACATRVNRKIRWYEHAWVAAASSHSHGACTR